VEGIVSFHFVLLNLSSVQAMKDLMCFCMANVPMQ